LKGFQNSAKKIEVSVLHALYAIHSKLSENYTANKSSRTAINLSSTYHAIECMIDSPSLTAPTSASCSQTPHFQVYLMMQGVLPSPTAAVLVK